MPFIVYLPEGEREAMSTGEIYGEATSNFTGTQSLIPLCAQGGRTITDRPTVTLIWLEGLVFVTTCLNS